MFDKIEAGGGEPPTKQFWVPVTNGSRWLLKGNFPAQYLTTSGEWALMSFYTPDDFHQIVEAYVVVVANCTVASPSWATNSDYAKAGEAYNTHSANQWTRPASVTNNLIYECDISSVLTSLEAQDYVGLQFYLWDDAHNVYVLGVMIKYD